MRVYATNYGKRSDIKPEFMCSYASNGGGKVRDKKICNGTKNATTADVNNI